MYYASLNKMDVANGPGVRTSLFVSGCQKALEGNPCPGCQNKDAWNKTYGNVYTINTEKEIIENMSKDYISGFSLLGGEPLSTFNLDEETKLLSVIKETYPKKDIWVWTGYVLEEWWETHKSYKKFFDYVDVVVDGPYIEALRDITLKFRGSSNQRILTKDQMDKILY